MLAFMRILQVAIMKRCFRESSVTGRASLDSPGPMQSDRARVAESAMTKAGLIQKNESFSRGYRAWLLFVLLLVNLLNLADRQGLAAVVPALKVDLRLSDTQLGLILGLGFAIFYTLLGLPIARLAEHRNRARIVALSSAVFSAFVFLCSTSRSFAQI